ncbi:MAG: hypothetical protein WC624_01255 [Candidatus Margulisiibacteriota bacterium]
MTVNYDPNRRDWSPAEAREYFTFSIGLKTSDLDAIYYGELITLYNPNIQRTTIEDIPEHTEEKPKEPSKSEIEALRNMLAPDLTLMANPSLIKKIKPPEDN